MIKKIRFSGDPGGEHQLRRVRERAETPRRANVLRTGSAHFLLGYGTLPASPADRRLTLGGHRQIFCYEMRLLPPPRVFSFALPV